MELSPPLIIVLVAASGYIFCNWCNLLKYDVLRIDLFRLEPIISIRISLESYIAQLCLGISFLATFLINLSPSITARTLERIWRKNDIDALCAEAASGIKPLSVTLDNRKVYIGLMADSPEPGKDANLTILPLYSGYRDKDTLEMTLTRKYKSVDALLAELIDPSGEVSDEVASKLDEYRVVIPRSRIVTINLSVNSLHKTMDEPGRSF